MNTPEIPEGFIPWAGGECPVPKKTIVDIFNRGNATFFERIAGAINWNHARYNSTQEIIGYRIHIPPVDWQARALVAEEELSIWKSVFPDIAPERVMPDRSLLEKELADLRAKAEKLAAALKNTTEWCAVVKNALPSMETIGTAIEEGRAALAEWEGKL